MHHLVDANLSSHIDGLLIMAGFRQCLNQRQTGERLGFAPHFHDFSQSGFRIGHHCWILKPLPSEVARLSPALSRMACTAWRLM